MNMSLRIRSLVAMLALAASACSDAPLSPQKTPAKITSLPRALTSSEQEVIAASNEFAFGLLRELNRTRADSNIFMSPLSASMALGMTMNGAAGTTFDEMRSALGFGSLPLASINESYEALIAMLRALDPGVEFRIANSIWYREGYPVETEFLGTTQNFFDAKVQALDFASASAPGTINDWVSQSTAGRIQKMVDEIDPNTIMFLMNAIYFKGAWRAQFPKASTYKGPFMAIDGTTQTVSIMMRNGPFGHGHVAGAEVIDLPYGGGAFSMTIVLPARGTSVNALAESLTPARWSEMTAAVRDANQELHMPKFTLRWEATLNDQLQALGMRQAFIGGGADFSAMSKSRGRDLYIHAVKQKSFVDVHEEGTEAAAVTSVEIREVSAPAAVVVDRPFLFAIRERLSGTILFVGKIVEVPE